MKKLLFAAAIAVFGFNVNAQDGGGQTDKGSWLIEANTGNDMLGTTGVWTTQ